MVFTAPEISWAALAPLLILFGAGVIGVLLEAFVPRGKRRAPQAILALVAFAAALVAVVWRFTVVLSSGPSEVVLGAVQEDGPALTAQMVLLVVAFLAMLVIIDRGENNEGAFTPSGATRPGSEEEELALKEGLEQTEVYPLTVFSVLGMMVFAASGDFLTLFVALEVLSLPLYVLTGLARRRRLLSQEAALKYFLLGALSSAIFLFGIVLLYGYAGSFRYADIAAASLTGGAMDGLLLTGGVMVLVGLMFKVGAVPFHAWTPDVYQGAPTPITGFMAAATKLAAFAAMMRFAYVVLQGVRWDFTIFAQVIIVLTMLVGTILGIVQSNVKRMLAYSSIAHAGFILIGVFAFQASAIPAVLFYLLAYGLATVGAFGVVTLVRERDEDGHVTAEALELKQWAGLAKRSPWLAGAMTVFLLSFAGIPLTAGFIGKYTVFSAGVAGDLTWLVVLAVLCSAATAFFYMRLIILMYFNEPEGNATVVTESEGFTSVAIAVTAAATVILGILPGPVLSLLSAAAQYVS